MKSSNEHKKFLGGDAPRILFLLLLYVTQGFAFGFLDTAMPIILKKKMTYTEVGIVAWCSAPYLLKFLFTPLVESTYSKSIGKRRSWIIPTQIIFGVLNIIMSFYFEELADQKCVYTLLVSFFTIFMWSAIQDIAVDGWCITMVKEENHGNATFSQWMGEEVGLFLWNACFFALNDIDFWNSYIYSSPQTSPLFTEQTFFFWWGIFILMLAVVTYFFVSEKNDRIQVDEPTDSFYEVVENISWFLRLKRTISFMILLLALKGFSKFNSLIGRMYLVRELHYNQAKYSLLTLMNFPIAFVCSIVILKYFNKKLMMLLVIINAIRVFDDIFTVNYLFTYVPQGFMFDIMLYSAFAIDVVCMKSWLIVIKMYANLVWDPKMASTQITFVQSAERFINILPKFYTYKVTDLFGLQTPNFIASVLTIGLSGLMWNRSSDPEFDSRMEKSTKTIKKD